jgi:membrane fusion protein, multidrug efflux system
MLPRSWHSCVYCAEANCASGDIRALIWRLRDTLRQLVARVLTDSRRPRNLPTSQLFLCGEPMLPAYPARAPSAPPSATSIPQQMRFLSPLINKLAIPAGIFAGLILLSGCDRKAEAPAAIRPALAHKIAPGGGADIDVYSGEIRARIEVDHAFRVSGKISRRLVDAGARVKRGQLLAELDPQDVTLAADAARSQVAALQTEADFADAELKRFRDLFSKGFISQSALDQKANVAAAARARLDAQKASANVSLNQAGYAKLIAQNDGVVTQVNAEAGQVVSVGQAVLKIADPSEMELAISVPESRVSDFRGNNAKRPIRVHLWSNPERFFDARVREVAGAADPVARTYATRISIIVPPAAKDSIGLGMSAFAAYVGSQATGTFSVPLSAIYVQANNAGVWKIAADGKVSLKPVSVVQYRETSALVTSTAVAPGDVIVAAGVHKLREGEVVRPIVDAQVKGDGKVALAPEPQTPAAEPATRMAAR